jgi:hypothetical protein
MPLILSPSFDDHTREEVEAHLDQVRIRRLAAAMEFQQSRLFKLEKEEGELQARLIRNYDQLGRVLIRIDRDMEKAQGYLEACTMLRTELDLTLQHVSFAKGKK